MSSSRHVVAIVLAAGAGRRLGTTKSLAKVGGKTFLTHILTRLQQASVSRIVVVVGAEVEDVMAAHHNAAVDWVLNRQWAVTGMMDSVRLGVRRLGCHDRALIWPVDCPLTSPETIRKLCTSTRSAVPRWMDKRGHPVILSHAATQETRDSSIGSLRELLSDKTDEVEVNDPMVVENINKPEDLARLERWLGIGVRL